MTTTPTDAQMKLARECAAKAYRDADPTDALAGYVEAGEMDDDEAVQSALLAIQATEARAQGLVDALEAAQNILINSGAESGYCCCGDPVSSHSIGSGHSPVDNHVYYAEQCCQNIEQALATWRRT